MAAMRIAIEEGALGAFAAAFAEAQAGSVREAGK